MSGLEIAEDLEFQRRTWRAERTGWAVLAAVLLAAALGVFGVGPLGDARARAADGSLTVDYQRFARMQSPLTLRVRVEEVVPVEGALEIWVSREYLAELSLRNTTPLPDRVELDADRVTFVFGWRGAPGPAVVTFVQEADRPGSVRGEVGVSGAAGVPVRHFLFP